jgi:2-methylaconitate cis-trans-isomerase PrpF
MIDASTLGLKGTEAQGDVNGETALLAKLEAIRAHSAVAMGLARTADEATNKRPNTPKLAFFGKPADYTASSGKPVAAAEIDITARIMSMGQMHHAMTGTGAVAIAAAAAVPGTIVSRILGSARAGICFGHASGRLRVGAETEQKDGQWAVANVTLSRSARRLMVGTVFVPESAFDQA